MILLVDVITIFTFRIMFKELLQDKTGVFVGILLFMTCPYKCYVSYECGDLSRALAWALIPLVLWGLFRVFHGTGNRISFLVIMIAFAMIGYVDVPLFLILLGISVLAVIWYRKARALLPLAGGIILSLPGWFDTAKYLITGRDMQEEYLIKTISKEGYVLGQFFTSWTYRDAHPGLGLILILAMIMLLWLVFVNKDLQLMKKYGFFVVVYGMMSFMSMICFPWDVAQRVAGVLLRTVSLLETPAIFFGFASLAACVLGAYAVECMRKELHVLFRK